MMGTMKYLAVLGRQPKISLAELEATYAEAQVDLIAPELAEIDGLPDEVQYLPLTLGGTQKLAVAIEGSVVDFLKALPKTGKITLGVSDYSRGATAFKAQGEALKLKRILIKLGHSVRVVPNKTAVLSSATSYHNHLWTDSKIELIKLGKKFYRVVQVQDIEAYALRDQNRPARDAKVGMLPPKLAQILINLCGTLPEEATLLDPFCGTGVVLQEALLMRFQPYGTDLSERMVQYSERNLKWLQTQKIATNVKNLPWKVEVGDATNHQWQSPVDAVAGEVYLGQPMSLPPAEIKLKQEKQECQGIILGFLKNLVSQIQPGTPVTIAVPAWLRPDGSYERLNILDEIQNLGYNVKRFRNVGQEDLLYHREKQVVAREIIVLRKR